MSIEKHKYSRLGPRYLLQYLYQSDGRHIFLTIEKDNSTRRVRKGLNIFIFSYLHVNLHDNCLHFI